VGTGIEVIKNKLFAGASLNMWHDIGIPELNVRTDLRGNIYAKEIDIDANWEIAPIGGLLFVPMDWLKLSYTYRGEMQQKNPVRINTTADLIPGASPGIELPINLRLMFIDYYLPQNHTWGIAIRPIDKLLLSFDLTWYKWSDFSIPSCVKRP